MRAYRYEDIYRYLSGVTTNVYEVVALAQQACSTRTPGSTRASAQTAALARQHTGAHTINPTHCAHTHTPRGSCSIHTHARAHTRTLTHTRYSTNTRTKSNKSTTSY
jgi:hypothetical protein